MGIFRVGIYQGGNFPGGNFPGGSLPGGSFLGGSLPGGSFPGGNFPSTSSDNGRIMVLILFVTKYKDSYQHMVLDGSLILKLPPGRVGISRDLYNRLNDALRKCLGKSLVSYEELLTILIEIQRILNNRPLTFVNDDVNEEILTPNHLVYGKAINVNYVDDNGDRNTDTSVRYKYIQELLDHFWKRWLNEYVVNLRETHKNVQSSKNIISVNDLVLIYGEKTPRSKWKIGKVNELITSADNNIRAAKVEYVLNGSRYFVNRPINKLYPVELANNRLRRDNDNQVVTNNIDHDVSSDDITIRFIDENDIPFVI